MIIRHKRFFEVLFSKLSVCYIVKNTIQDLRETLNLRKSFERGLIIM